MILANFLLENLLISSSFPLFSRDCLEPSPSAIPVLCYTSRMMVATLLSIVLLPIALWCHVWTVVSDITDLINLKRQVVSLLLARLHPELSRAMCCINICYTRIPASPSLSLLYQVNASSTTPVMLHENSNCPAILTKGFAINDGADEVALIASSKYSCSKCSQDRPQLALPQLSPGLSTKDERCSLKSVTGHLLPSLLVLCRNPFIRDIHLPNLFTEGAPLRIRLLRFEIFFFPWSR